jgi:hypothetical protein
MPVPRLLEIAQLVTVLRFQIVEQAPDTLGGIIG